MSSFYIYLFYSIFIIIYIKYNEYYIIINE